MVPHVKEKLTGAIEDLEMFLEDHENDDDLSDTELLEKARIQIEEANTFVEGIQNEDDEGEMTENNAEEKEDDEEEDDDEDMPMGDDE